MSSPSLQLPSQEHQPSLILLSLCRKGDYPGVYEQLFERLRARKNTRYKLRQYIRTQCLLYAAAQGNLEAVRKLVQTFSFNPRYVFNGLSPLHCAIAYGHMEIVTYLVEKGCSQKTERNEQFVCAKRTPVSNYGFCGPNSLLFVSKLTDYSDSVSKYSLDGQPIEVSHVHVDHEILKFLFGHGWTYNKQQYEYYYGNGDAHYIVKFLMLSGTVDDLRYLVDHGHLTREEIKMELKRCFIIAFNVPRIDLLDYLLKENALHITVEMIKDVASKISAEFCMYLLDHCAEDVHSTHVGRDYIMGQYRNIVLLDYTCRNKLFVLSKAIAERNLNSQDSAGRTPLHIACEHDDLELVSFLVSQQCDQSIADTDGCLALHVACMHSSLEILKLLSFDDKSTTDKVGNTVVHIACRRVGEDIIEYLIEHKSCAMNVVNNRHELPLHILINGTGRNKPSNLKLSTLEMLSNSVDINTPDSNGWTPVRIACDGLDLDILEYLACRRACRLDIDGVLPLNYLIMYNYRDEVNATVIKILGCNNFDADKEDKEHNTLLHCACSVHSIELVRYLVVEKECNVNKVNSEGNLPLHIACDSSSPSLELVKLVTSGIDVAKLALRNTSGDTPLHIVCGRSSDTEERKAIARHLVGIGCRPVDNPEPFSDLDIELACADKNDFDLLLEIATKENVNRKRYGRSPLHLACVEGNVFAVRHFTQVLGCDSSTPYHGKLPLHHASAHSVEMVEYVVKDADVNAVDNNDNTPLHIACQGDLTDTVKFLTKNPLCDQSKLNGRQEYPLHLSCEGSLETVKLLTITTEHLLQISSSGLTPLHVACKFNKLDIVRHLLEVMKELGLEVSSVVERGTVHPLRLACETGNAQLVKCLVENGVNMSDKLPDGNTVLHIGCSVGSLEIVKYLIDSGHDTLITNSRKEFPLHIACTKNLDLVKFTSYKCGAAELEAKTVDGLTSLHLAASSGLLKVVEYLIETLHCNPLACDDYGKIALTYACGFPKVIYNHDIVTHPCVARYLLECGCDPMEKIWLGNLSRKDHTTTTVQKAIDLCDLDLLSALCSNKMFINRQDEDGNTPLLLLLKQALAQRVYLTEEKAFLEKAVEYLVKERCCDQRIQNSKQEIALHLACETGSIEFVNKLGIHCIKNGAGNTALHIVCQGNYLHILEHILLASKHDAGLDSEAFDVVNNKSQNLLHLAVISDSEEMVKLLLSEIKGISCLCKDSKGLAPVHYASSVSVLKVLTDHNIENRDLLDSSGNSPLHTFIKSKNYPLADFLLSLGAPVEVKNRDGSTPLHFSCKRFRQRQKFLSTHFNLPTIKQLLSRVSSLSVQNNDGDTPLHIACRSRNVQLVKLLLKSQHEVDLTIQNNSGDTPFHIACAMAHFPVVDALAGLDSAADVLAVKNSHGDIPFHVALRLFQRSRRGKVQKSKSSLEFFANNCSSDINIQNNDGETLLHLSCKIVNSHSTHIVKFLVKIMHSDLTIVDVHKQLPLHVAASRFLELVELCCSQTLINEQDEDGNTALHIACMHSKLEIARFLLNEKKCDSIIKNQNGQTPLHCACKNATSTENNGLIALLAQNSKASLNLQDADGDTPIHLLCRNSSLDGISRVTMHDCNFDLQNNSGETPLHIVCSSPKSTLELVKCVANCDPELKLKDSPCDTALHLACRSHSSKVIQFLLENGHQDATQINNEDRELPIHILCKRDSLTSVQLLFGFFKDFDKQNIHGDTPLHIAVKNGLSDEIIVYLVEEANCDVTIQNEEGDLPLHIACRNTSRFVGKLQTLLATSKTVNVHNVKGNSVLHEYCIGLKSFKWSSRNHRLDVNTLEFLLKLEAKPSKNVERKYPIHLACRYASLATVILFKPCGLTAESTDGSTVLHEACANNTDHAPEIVRYLFDYQPPLDYSSANADGDLALHIACRNPKLSDVIAEQLLQHCNSHDINLPNNAGNTIFFELMHNKHTADLVLYLLKSENVDLKIVNGKVDTILHLACRHNYTPVVSFLVSQKLPEVKEFINRLNADKQTPIVLTTDREIVQLLLDNGAESDALYKMHDKFFRDYSLSSPPEMPVSILVVGDPRAGKTTLVSSLKKEKEGTKSETLHRTAGIVPNDFKSVEYGQVIMYDFAGQPEYYASHDAVIHAIIKKLPPVVLLVVDLTLPIDHTIRAVNYWSSFISNRLQSLTDRAHLYIICSHADVVKEKGEDPQKKAKALLDAVKATLNEVKVFNFEAMLTMDCTDPQSQELGKLRSHFVTSTKQLRKKAVINFESHCLSVYMKQTFADKIVILFDKLLFEVTHAAKKSKDAPKLLPKDPNQLKKICQDLNDTGLIVFLEGSHCSWLVLDKDALLQEVSGKLFAPDSFPEYVGVYGSPTGVVSFSKLRETFPHYDPNMLFGFLCQMEYCQEIIDENVMQILGMKQAKSLNKHYFFPHAVRAEQPSKVWEHNKGYQFGWIMECDISHDHHFTPYFVHILLLRLIFSQTDIMQLDISFHSRSTIWKSGLTWLNTKGISTLVDVIDHGSKVVVLVHCKDAVKDKVNCLLHRSSLLKIIRRIKISICPAVEVKEFLMDPEHLSVRSEVVISIEDIMKQIMQGDENVFSSRGKLINLDSLLFCDPYIKLCAAITGIIQNAEYSQQQPDEEFLTALSGHLDDYFEVFIQLISPSKIHVEEISSHTKKFLKLFNLLLRRKRNPFQTLREEFDNITVFDVNSKLPGTCV